MLKQLLDLNNLDGNYKKINDNVQQGVRTMAYGLSNSAKQYLAGFLHAPILYIVANKVEADIAIENLASITENNVLYIPAKPEVLLSATKFSRELLYERMNAIYKLATQNPQVIVTTMEACMGILPNAESFKNRCFTLEKGMDIAIDELVAKLINIGYSRVDKVEGMGQFFVRGDIVDIYSIDNSAYRLDFWGDSLERIKVMDTDTMRSSGDITSLQFYPIFDVIIEDNERDELQKAYKKALPKPSTADEEQKIQRKYEEMVQHLQTESVSNNNELLPLLKGKNSIFDYLNDDTLIVIDEFNKCYDISKSHYEEHKTRYTALLESCDILTTQLAQLTEIDTVIKSTNKFKSVALNNHLATDRGFKPKDLLEFKMTPIVSYQNQNDEIVRDVNNWLKLKYKVVICGKNPEIAKKLTTSISQDKGMVSYLENSDEDINGAVICPIHLSHGFILHEQRIVVIGSDDVLKKSTTKIVRKKGNTDAFLTPEVGDYIVHETHGIGLLKSISTIQTGQTVKDYAIIEYKGGDTLYVPAEQMDMLVKFSGSDKVPKLSKIGGKDFENVKAKVRASIKAMTFDLKKLYADRQRQTGYEFQQDTAFQQEFEDNFPYDATEDQIRSIDEIKSDMMSKKVMDRLLVGDVGYGKTEVAFRSAFKAIEAGKQVCLLAPTTILSYQHFQTARKRFKGFGIRIDYLNRFKDKSLQEKTLIELANGKVDMIIGTHRLLSKDVQFQDLGLLILDEEQRFGVEHKEKIKNLKGDIDVLSMSATPIPRTLHMSLSGIRDISTIETPPSKRLPIQVMVLEQSDGLIVDAIVRELSRGGQVYVLYNSVKGINSFGEHLKALLPDAKLVVAHGQMQPKQLEDTIDKFILGEYDILVSTTIIENGIDISRANTMIVIGADKFGLSQLYQLKGRVGRSDKLAYVYYMYSPNKVLTEVARKRLNAIMQFTEFGSGFKIAMRDLEIRGSGNILGREQHGHMEQVGYDMYCKLLKEAMEGDGSAIEQFICEVDVDVSAYISDKYIPLSSSRLDVYREIATIKSLEEVKNTSDELTDIYGKVPNNVMNLCKISLIRHLGEKIRCKKIYIRNQKCNLYFDMEALKNEKIHDYLQSHKQKTSLSMSHEIMIEVKESDTSKALNYVSKMLAVMTLSDKDKQ